MDQDGWGWIIYIYIYMYISIYIDICCEYMLWIYVVNICCEYMFCIYVVNICCEHMVNMTMDIYGLWNFQIWNPLFVFRHRFFHLSSRCFQLSAGMTGCCWNGPVPAPNWRRWQHLECCSAESCRVIYHGCGKSPFLVGISTINGNFQQLCWSLPEGNSYVVPGHELHGALFWHRASLAGQAWNWGLSFFGVRCEQHRGRWQTLWSEHDDFVMTGVNRAASMQ